MASATLKKFMAMIGAGGASTPYSTTIAAGTTPITSPEVMEAIRGGGAGAAFEQLKFQNLADPKVLGKLGKGGEAGLIKKLGPLNLGLLIALALELSGKKVLADKMQFAENEMQLGHMKNLEGMVTPEAIFYEQVAGRRRQEREATQEALMRYLTGGAAGATGEELPLAMGRTRT